jgi:soluble cytochrome b562
MEHPHKPMEVINSWQEWAKNNRVVAEMDEPLVTKDSRENLHDTSNARSEIKDWRSFFKELIADSDVQEYGKDIVQKACEQKATEYFADTITEFLSELGGEKLYECFVAAATQSFEIADKEYQYNKVLIDKIKKKK